MGSLRCAARPARNQLLSAYPGLCDDCVPSALVNVQAFTCSRAQPVRPGSVAGPASRVQGLVFPGDAGPNRTDNDVQLSPSAAGCNVADPPALHTPVSPGSVPRGASAALKRRRSKATADTGGSSATSTSLTLLPPPTPGGLLEKLGSSPLRLIIVGHNPSDHAWITGHYYRCDSKLVIDLEMEQAGLLFFDVRLCDLLWGIRIAGYLRSAKDRLVASRLLGNSITHLLRGTVQAHDAARFGHTLWPSCAVMQDLFE